jgi:UDP-N-acetylglucosamine/UDP-N-acetylgalactosamine diphosphorylase
MTIENKVKRLSEKGVKLISPSHVEIGEDVDLERISGDCVTIYGGSRIFGSSTFISKGCTLGQEGPATIDNCWLGPDVKINGGYVKSSVFLSKVSIGYGAHIREGCILEEESSIAHSVGLKQTILFPYVTLGSLINFCDCFMAGGTNRKNHSEVGSSYIHFNYTPNQDKATASLIGDVPKGVMLNNRPIFLGGQGGLVGPCRLNLGTVIAAGTIQRKDELEPDRLLFGGALRPGNIKHTPGQYQNVPRIIKNNGLYIANLIALMSWYRHVRVLFISDTFQAPLLDGLKSTLSIGISERIKRLRDFVEKAALSKDSVNEEGMTKKWEGIEQDLRNHMVSESIIQKDKFMLFSEGLDRVLQKTGLDNYTSAIKAFDEDTAAAGTSWLSSVVDVIQDKISRLIPEFKS